MEEKVMAEPSLEELQNTLLHLQKVSELLDDNKQKGNAALEKLKIASEAELAERIGEVRLQLVSIHREKHSRKFIADALLKKEK